MRDWVVEQQAALVCGGGVDPFLNARCTLVLARHVGIETLNQILDQRYPILNLLAGHSAYAGSSPTVARR